MKYYEVLKIDGEPPEKICLIRCPSNNVKRTIIKHKKKGVVVREVSLEEFEALFSIIMERTGTFNVLQ